MRYLIGNWKMQLGLGDSVALAEALKIGADDALRVVVCPDHLALEEVGQALAGTGIALGGQDAFWEDKGAFTGEVSPKSLAALGCAYCIVGHSERREFLGETDAMVAKKTAALLRNGMTPIVCVGETRIEREEGRRDGVVIAQLKNGLAGISLAGDQRLIIAYEPRWVIGTGNAVAPSDAAAMHHLIINTLHELFPEDVVNERCAVIYGGAVDASNIGGFMAESVISGALVGGASLKPDVFAAIAAGMK